MTPDQNSEVEPNFTAEPLKELRTYREYGESPSFTSRQGLGKILTRCINLDTLKEVGVMSDSTEDIPIGYHVSLSERGDDLVLEGRFSDPSDNTDEKTIYIPDGIPATTAQVVTAVKESRDPNITVENPSSGGTLLVVSDGTHQVRVNLMEVRGLVNLSSGMKLNQAEDLKSQAAAFVNLSGKILRLVGQLPGNSFEENPQAVEGILASSQERLDELREKIPVSEIHKAHERQLTLAQILNREEPPYAEVYQELESKRQEDLKKVVEPNFVGVPFPYLEMVKHDFSYHPFLEPERSDNATASLARVLEDQGVPLKERVVKEHYAWFVRTKNEDGTQNYNLITAPGGEALSRENIKIGMTHDWIRMTQEHRTKDGANYEVAGWGEDDFDSRGVIFETSSGKKYAIWDLPQTREIIEGKGAMGLKGDYKFDSGLLRDFEKRYGVITLMGQEAHEALEQEILTTFVDEALKIEGQKSLSNTDYLRNRLLLKGGILPD